MLAVGFNGNAHAIGEQVCNQLGNMMLRQSFLLRMETSVFVCGIKHPTNEQWQSWSCGYSAFVCFHKPGQGGLSLFGPEGFRDRPASLDVTQSLSGVHELARFVGMRLAPTGNPVVATTPRSLLAEPLCNFGYLRQ